MQIRSVITDEMIDIPIPKSHSGVGVIQARLISAHSRDGMVSIVRGFIHYNFNHNTNNNVYFEGWCW